MDDQQDEAEALLVRIMMIRDDWKRSMLFELDQNIASLRARIGDTDEVLGLTGHYHNLLRQWAEV